VDHREIIPDDAKYCFNSVALEACLYKIPNLSEHFLFANDDMFVNKPLTQDYFFNENDNPIQSI
jgi:hypothetical protein